MKIITDAEAERMRNEAKAEIAMSPADVEALLYTREALIKQLERAWVVLGIDPDPESIQNEIARQFGSLLTQLRSEA